MQLYGREWTRRELEARVGRIGQIGGVRRMTLSEGAERGTELIEVRTGAGLRFHVVPSKGLDISLAEWRGVPISWQSPNGDAHPSRYDARGTEWLRTASGGLLMTCGLSHIGAPDGEGATDGVMHGRAHHTPAVEVSAETEWAGDELRYRVAGTVGETAIFGAKLRLRREIRGQLGSNRVEIEDCVENVGFRPAPHRILYHFNFGFPLMMEETRLLLPEAAAIAPAVPGTPIEGYDRWPSPDPDCRERVYYHRLQEDGMAEATVINPAYPAGPVAVTLRWSADTLPLLVQWKMPGAGEHVLGLEPANAPLSGAPLGDWPGRNLMLQPGQRVSYRLELNIAGGAGIMER